jgi:hypothetical protein
MYLSLTHKGIIAIIFALIVAFLVIFTAGSVGL